MMDDHDLTPPLKEKGAFNPAPSVRTRIVLFLWSRYVDWHFTLCFHLSFFPLRLPVEAP